MYASASPTRHKKFLRDESGKPGGGQSRARRLGIEQAEDGIGLLFLYQTAVFARGCVRDCNHP